MTPGEGSPSLVPSPDVIVSVLYIYTYSEAKKVFSQPPIVQVLPLKDERPVIYHRYTSTMTDKMRKKIQKITVGFLINLFANYGGK